MQEEEDNSSNWKPLESNPEVINEYVANLGFNTETLVFQDVFSVEEWAQQMVPQPCIGLLLIFPITDNHKKHRAEEAQRIENEGQKVDEDLFYMHQYARNACGTVGVFHILGNLPEDKRNLLDPEGKLAAFYKECEGKTPKERGMIFKGSKGVRDSHSEAVQKGSTDVREFCRALDGRREPNLADF